MPTLYVPLNVLLAPLFLTNPAKRKSASMAIFRQQDHAIDVVIKLVMLQKY